MKTVFICGSLEPGRDGVGDYTRRLAGELIKLGHTAGIIALNDTHINDTINGTQDAEGVLLPVLRLSSLSNLKNRLAAAQHWIDDVAPDWISVQYVPYAFDKRGLPFFLGPAIKKIAKNRKAHVMFHENWVGADIGTGWKRLLMARLQRQAADRLLDKLRPSVIHTHVPVNWLKLKKLGWRAKELPLFSNISFNGLTVKDTERNCAGGSFRIGFFSQADPNEAIQSFLRGIGDQLVQRNMKPEVLLIGGEISRMHILGDALEKINHFKNAVTYTGFLESKEISLAIQTCALGITPIARHALGKSGSVAAFLEHGIPVAAPNSHHLYNPAEIGYFSPSLRAAIIVEPDMNLLQPAKQAAVAAMNEISLSTIAQTFLNDLARS